MDSNLELSQIRTLDLSAPSQPGRPSFIAAASGLVVIQNHFFVIADDELAVGCFRLNENTPGSLFPVFPGSLPLEKRERKKLKPDLEALCFIPLPEQSGALLAIPSGSKPNRTQGAWIPCSQAKLSSAQLFDLSPLYRALPFQDLNIEGAVVQDAKLLLFQRGNSKSQENAIVILDLNRFLKDIQFKQTASSDSILEIKKFNLGQQNGLSLSFTDATLFEENQVLYLASTEDTDNPYEDGEFQGASLGLLDANLNMNWQKTLNISFKPEGLAFGSEKNPGSLYIVTDSDDATVPALLYETQLN